MNIIVPILAGAAMGAIISGAMLAGGRAQANVHKRGNAYWGLVEMGFWTAAAVVLIAYRHLA